MRPNENFRRSSSFFSTCSFQLALYLFMPSPIRHLTKRFTIAVAVSFGLFSAPATITATAEEWTDLRGTRTIEAKMVGMWGDNVVLQLQSGKRVTVNTNSLRSDSRIQANRLQRELAEARTTRIGELQDRAVESALPAPNPLPSPPKTSAYQPIAANQKVDAFLKSIDDQIRSGHVIALFDSLPPSYRADLAGLVKEASMKIEAPGWDQTVGALHQFADTLVTHQRWFLSHPRIATLPTIALETVEGEVLTIADALRVGLAPEVTNLKGLQSGGFETWLKTFDAATADHFAQAFRLSSIAARTITVESEKDGVAIVTIENDAGKSKVTYQNVEGFWVPKSMADSWTDKIASMKQYVADAPAGTLLGPIALLGAPLQQVAMPMASAPTEDAFHGAMESMFTSTETFIAAAGQVLGKDFSLAKKTAGNGYGNGYGNSGSSESDYEAQMQAEYNEQMAAEQATRSQ